MGGKRKIKIPYAIKDGRLVHISNVVPGRKCACVCVVCGKPLVARKGATRQAHFAHDSDSTCSAETALHQIGKLLLKQRIDEAIANRQSVPLLWHCTHCEKEHQAELLKKAYRCEVEHPISDARADLALLDREGSSYAALEIVVTHEPEEKTTQLYRQMDVRLVRFDLKSEADLIKLTDLAGVRPDFVDHCVLPRCPTCRTFLRERKLYVMEDICWRCGCTMRIAFGHDGRAMISPEDFANYEADAAREKGVLLQVRFSKTTEITSLMNVCPHCDVISGSFFLHQHWTRITASNTFDVALGCPTCARVFPAKQTSAAVSQQQFQLDDI